MNYESDIDDPGSWIRYDTYAKDRAEHFVDMIEHFEIGGPGPPFEFPEPPEFFLPPQPIPGSGEECVAFSSHFENCDISKVHNSEMKRHSVTQNIALVE